MLVKELRQGLRARTFIAVFLALQIMLGIMLLFASASDASDRAGSVVSGMIFTFFAIAVLIVQPLRGVAAIASEIKSNTIEMMVLTRLSAWRIVYGKWVAIVSQSALILITIIPYFILRYFFGGMNLVGEIVFLSLIFLTSMALTALTVGLSGSSSGVIRALIPLVATPVMFFGMIGLTFGGASRNLIESCSLDDREAIIGIVFYIISIVYLGWSSLTLGASLIAPAAENHSTLRRCITLFLLISLMLVTLFYSLQKEAVVLLMMVIVAPALVLALTESPRIVPLHDQGVGKNKPVRRIFRLFLQPGLAAGIFFSAGVGALVACITFLHPDIAKDQEMHLLILALFGAFLLPAVVQSFTFKTDAQRIANYILLMVGSCILTVILATLSQAIVNREFLWLFVWNPLVFIIMESRSEFDGPDLLLALLIVNAVFIILLFIKAFMVMKAHRELVSRSAIK